MDCAPVGDRFRQEFWWKKADGKRGEGEVEVVSGGLVEDALGEGGGGFGSGGADGPEDDVECGGMRWE